jgi:hypothetical protein
MWDGIIFSKAQLSGLLTESWQKHEIDKGASTLDPKSIITSPYGIKNPNKWKPWT